MEYTQVTNTDPVIQYLADTLKQHLNSGKEVLWLLSGGSGAKVCLAVATHLQDTSLVNLYVTLSDERFGPVGHADENWQQLLDNGFRLDGATLYRPLQGKDRKSTTDDFGAWLKDHIQTVDYTIGLFGIGADGHTAGIKPHTAAVTADGWAIDFAGDDFERITMTFHAITQLDEVVIQAMGHDKAQALDSLIHQDIPLSTQPAQVLKTVKKHTLFTDYKEN